MAPVFKVTLVASCQVSCAHLSHVVYDIIHNLSSNGKDLTFNLVGFLYFLYHLMMSDDMIRYKAFDKIYIMLNG